MPTGLPARDGIRPWRLARGDVLGLGAIGLLAFACRLGLILVSPGGLTGNLGDDDATYYAGATALIHGRVPYRDFVLLHPPLVELYLAPFAALGAVVGDLHGFVAAAIGNDAVGAVNAVLVVAVCRRYGLRRAAAYPAGALYAVLLSGAFSDVVGRLETLGSLLLLLGLLALTGHRRRYAVLAGVALGAAATAKIWGVLPAGIVLLWWCISPHRRDRALDLAAGMAAAIALVCGPFFLLAPRAMLRMVVADQLGRAYDDRPRLPALTGVSIAFPHLQGTALTVVLTVVGVAVAALFAMALRVPAARPVVVVALAQLVLLLSAPSFFTHYTGFVTPAFAVSAGAAADAARVPGRRWARAMTRAGRPVLCGLLAAATVTTVAALSSVPPALRLPTFPRSALVRALSGARCPTPDGPMVLIQTDRLTDTLEHGCPNWIDVTGRVYDVDRSPRGAGAPRATNARWQRALRHYLLSGSVVILYRPGLGVGPRLRAELHRLPVLVDEDGVVAYRVRPGP